MTTLSRQTQKVFASNADADQIAVFGSMKTGTPVYSTNLATLQSTAYTEGWSEALLADKAPYLEEMNAVQYGLSYQIAYLLQEGAPEYDASTNYSDTSIVKVIDGNGLSFYRSLVDDNLSNSLSDTDYWALIPIANVQPQLALKADLSYVNGLFKTYETTWSDYAANTKYTFDLSSEDISDIDVTHWNIEVWAKIKTTAVAGFSVGSIYPLKTQNNYGGASIQEAGVGIIIENKVLTLWTGNFIQITSSANPGYNNVQLKIVIKAMEEIS